MVDRVVRFGSDSRLGGYRPEGWLILTFSWIEVMFDRGSISVFGEEFRD